MLLSCVIKLSVGEESLVPPSIKEQDEIFLKIIHMLAEYSFYAGVGYKTTMGMGQCKKL